MIFLLLFLQFLHFIDNLLSHETESAAEHVLHIALLTSHRIQAYQHLRDSYRHIERAGHALPPGPRAIRELQLTEFAECRTDTVLHEVVVEEVYQPLFLFCLIISIHHPRGLTEQQVFQFLILLKGTCQ